MKYKSTNHTNMQWQNEKILDLIEAYKAKKHLWSTVDHKYRDKNARKAAFEEISDKLNIPVFEIDKKLHGLRTQFQREQKRNTKSTWFAFDSLKFLLNVEKSKKATKVKREKQIQETKKEEQQDDLMENSSSYSVNVTSSLYASFPQDNKDNVEKRKYDSLLMTDLDQNDEEFKRKSLLLTPVKDRQIVDHLETFGKYVTEELKNIEHDTFSVQVAKHKINQIIFEATTGAYRKV